VSFYKTEAAQHDSLSLYQFANELDRLAKAHNDLDLKWEAELVRAQYHYRQLDRPAASVKHLSALSEMNAPKWFSSHIANMLGYYYMNTLQEFEQGLFHFARAAELVRDEDGMTYPYRQKFLYHLGMRLCHFSSYENAIGHLHEAVATPVPQVSGLDYRIHTYNTLGYAFRKLNMLDSSDHYFHLAYALSDRPDEDAWHGVVSGNIGENHYLRGNMDAAIPYLEEDLTKAQTYLDWGLASNAAALLGDIRLRQGRLREARLLLDSAWVFAHRSLQFPRLADVYPRMAKLYAAENNAPMAQRYIDSTLFVTDSLERVADRFSATRAEQRLRLEDVRTKAKAQEITLSTKLRERNFAVLSVLLMGVIIVLVLNQKRLKAKLGQQLAEEKRSEAERQLEQARLRLDDFMEDMKNHEPECELPELEKPKHTNAEELERSVILTDRQWREFTDLFEKVNPGFFARLKEKLPGLSPAETRFMALSRMRLGNKEMADMLGISPEAIRQTRSRLKRKLDMDMALEQFALEV